MPHLALVDDRPERELILEITVPGDPVSKQRVRTGKGRTYTPAKTLDAERTLEFEFLAAGMRNPTRADVIVDVDFFVPDRRRRDIDNLLKLVFDAANGYVWDDDSQVICLFAAKFVDRENPRTELRVWKVNA